MTTATILAIMLYAACFVLGFFIQTIVHECAHVMMAKLFGGEIQEFRIWPSNVDGKWLLGYVVFTPPDGGMTNTQHILVAGAPMILNVIVALVTVPLVIYMSGTFTVWTCALNIWCFSNMLDLTSNMSAGVFQTACEGADLMKVSERAGISMKHVQVFSCVSLVVMSYGLGMLLANFMLLPLLLS